MSSDEFYENVVGEVRDQAELKRLRAELTRLRALLTSGQCVDLERVTDESLRGPILDLAFALENGDEEEVVWAHEKFHKWLVKTAGVKA